MTAPVQLIVLFIAFFHAASVSEVAQGQAAQPAGKGAQTLPPVPPDTNFVTMQYCVSASQDLTIADTSQATVVALGCESGWEPASEGSEHPVPPVELTAESLQRMGCPPTHASPPHGTARVSLFTVMVQEHEL
ncbi:MAG: hypothetical protein NVS3B20_04250 [Polyangiales bacterium]